MLNFNVIVVTTDLSDYSLRALPYVIGLAERFSAKVKLLCVHEPTPPLAELGWASCSMLEPGDAVLCRARKTLARIVEEQVPPGVEIESEVRTGNAVQTIVEFARQQNADLLVMCTHGRTGFSHALMGSTAEAVVRLAPCPVLTLRQPMPVAAVQHGT
jgi:nucleotide-binding universal stress UspA family protein